MKFIKEFNRENNFSEMQTREIIEDVFDSYEEDFISIEFFPGDWYHPKTFLIRKWKTPNPNPLESNIIRHFREYNRLYSDRDFKTHFEDRDHPGFKFVQLLNEENEMIKRIKYLTEFKLLKLRTTHSQILLYFSLPKI